jgi:hypothetical protein
MAQRHKKSRPSGTPQSAHAPKYNSAFKMVPFERDRHHPPRRTIGRIVQPDTKQMKIWARAGRQEGQNSLAGAL